METHVVTFEHVFTKNQLANLLTSPEDSLGLSFLGKLLVSVHLFD